MKCGYIRVEINISELKEINCVINLQSIFVKNVKTYNVRTFSFANTIYSPQKVDLENVDWQSGKL